MRALEIQLAPKLLRQLSTTRRRETLFPFLLCERRIDLPIVMWFIGAGPRHKVWQFAQVNVELHRAAFNRNPLHPRSPPGIRRASEEPQSLSRISIRTHRARGNPLAPLEPPSLPRQD